MQSKVSVSVPIWLTLIRIEFATPRSIPFCRNVGVCYKQIIADKLHVVADLVSQKFPAIPIVFGHSVFDGNDRILIAPVLPVRNHLIAGQFSLVALFENVFLAVVKLARGRIERQHAIAPGCVAGLRDRLENRFDRFVIRFQIWCESAFVTDARRVTFLLQNCFELMKNFGADSQRLAETLRHPPAQP